MRTPALRGNLIPDWVIGTLGLIRKGMDQNLGKIPGTININELQKIILLGKVHILRKFLSNQ